MKENEKINWKDYSDFINEIYNRLELKKLVALLDNYDMAEGDLFLELFPCVSDDSDLAEKIWASHKLDYDVNAWFDKLGTQKDLDISNFSKNKD